jgi:hypothetical protein
MREAGELLRKVGETDDRMQISRRLLDVAYRLDGLRGTAPGAATQAPAPEAGDEPVPIESLAYDDDAEIVPIESLAPDQGEPATTLELSFRTYQRLLGERAPAEPSIDVLLGRTTPAPAPVAGPASAPPAVPASGLTAVPASAPATPPTATPAVPEEPPVEIDALCYSGHAALERAVAVRHQITAQLTQKASLESLEPLLQELLDLVPRALGES